MTTWNDVIVPLLGGHELTYDQAYWAMDQVMRGELGDVRLASLLTALRVKGETVAEVHGLADAMADHAEQIDIPRDVVDIVGTGGDGAHTVNVSTMAVVVAAAAGAPVVKHGNRASTSACGSADVLEALGLRLDLGPSQIAHVFSQVGIAFLFAKRFHPSMRFAAPVRRALGFPTVFNMLGPVTNPARPRASVVGVAGAHQAPLVAGIFAQRGSDALVFRGQRFGLDELTTVEPADVWEVHGGAVTQSTFDAAPELGLSRARVEDLRGGDAAHNAQVARSVFEGASGPVRDAVLVNAAAGLVAHGRLEGTRLEDGTLAERLRAGFGLAREAVDQGRARGLLQRWVSAAKAEG